MEAIGQLTGSIAHDFNNLLTIILGNIDFVQSFHDLPEAVDEALGDSVSAGRDARELIKSLLVFAKNETVQAERLNVVNLLTSFTPILARVLPKCIQLKFEYDGYNAIVLMNRYALENAMLNLVFNAKDALPKGGIIQIRCSVGDKTSGTPLLQGRHNVTIVVKDDGIGMTEPQRASAIEPFFTTKSLGQGSGLGLSSVFGSVSQAGGTLEINSKLNQGTEVILNIPTLKDAEKSSHEASLSALEEHEKIKDLMRTNSFSALRDKEILLVDDNYSIRSLDKKTFVLIGAHVTEAKSSEEALSLFESAEHTFKVVVIDIVMLGRINSYELAAEIEKLRPGIKIILTTGLDKYIVEEINYPLLKKPYSIYELLLLANRVVS